MISNTKKSIIKPIKKSANSISKTVTKTKNIITKEEVTEQELGMVLQTLKTVITEVELKELITNGSVICELGNIFIEDIPEIVKGLGLVIHDSECIIRAIKKIDVNLDNYFTKDETINIIDKKIKDALDESEGNCDLSNYYTKTETDQEIKKQIDELDVTCDLSNYYTKTESDQEIKKQIEESVGEGLTYSDNKISLSDEYVVFLENQTYKKPTLSFSLESFPSGNQEVGITYKGSKTLTNNVSNPQNMDGQLILSGLGVSESVNIGENTSINFNYVTNSNRSHQIHLKGFDIKNNTIQSSKSFNTIHPLFSGLSGEQVNIEHLTKNMISSPINFTKTYLTDQEGMYVWFCVPSYQRITVVTANGFGSTMNPYIEIEITNNYDHTFQYHCYRTAYPIKKGVSYEFKITK